MTQAANRDVFTQAAACGKRIMADPDRLALYLDVQRETGQSLFSLMVEDYYTEPVAAAIDLSAYGGNPGDVISIIAIDGVAVTGVKVALHDERGCLLEPERAELGAPGGERVYAV